MNKVTQTIITNQPSVGHLMSTLSGVKYFIQTRFHVAKGLLAKGLLAKGLQANISAVYNATAILLCISSLYGCGILEPNYKKYAEACSKTCPESQTAFEANMAVLATDCAGCHSTTAIKGKNLSSTDAAKNRTTILGFVKSGCQYTAELLTNKLTGGSHGGGLKNDPTLIQVQTWLAAEKACNQ